ncbi:hypothetical protein SS50377_24605 [Spironucleus salmonicida]|uniref:Uncharacterized protein n=1 Tax=Spironucleus salmonicida TaxID=348837 RepID=V6LIZ5_9EUKA|nr:hypothetical protein SS50377_24605 [Spironucleus salmonicida]|eukprot:EST44542.1 Hypothetical protein SS50377_15542 [Spironucleus salmonicida]
MLLVVLATFYREHAVIGRPNYIACNSSSQTNKQYLAYQGTIAELNTKIISESSLTLTSAVAPNVFDLRPALGNFEISKVAGMQQCSSSIKTDCYVLVDSSNISNAKNTACAEANVLITVASLIKEPLSAAPNMFATAEISSGVFSGLILIFYFFVAFYPAVTIQEPISMPKGEHDQ